MSRSSTGSWLVAAALGAFVCLGAAAPDAGGFATAVRSPAIGADQDVSFSSGAATIYASVRLPVSTNTPVPFAVIINGSGPVDRNGNVEPTEPDTGLWLADRLSEAGYASIRYDKLTSGETGLGPYAAGPDTADQRMFDYPPAFGDTTFDETFVQPARAAAAYMARLPGIDATRFVVVGHSEGGQIALAVADEPGIAPIPRSVVLVEPLYTRVLDAVRRQFDDSIDDADLPADEATALETWMDAGIAEIREGTPPFGPAPLPPLPDAIGPAAELQTQIVDYVDERYRNRLGKTEDEIDPVVLARRLHGEGRVLVTCGTKDFNTPCELGGPDGSGVSALAAAFPPGVAELVVIDDMIHELRDIGDADEDSIAPASWPDYPFSEQLDASLSRFLAERRVVTPDEQDGGLAVALLVGGAAVAVVAGAIGIVVIRRRRPTPG